MEKPEWYVENQKKMRYGLRMAFLCLAISCIAGGCAAVDAWNTYQPVLVGVAIIAFGFALNFGMQVFHYAALRDMRREFERLASTKT